MTCLMILNFEKVHWNELLLFPVPLKVNCLQLKIMPFQHLNWNTHLQSLAHKLSKVSFMIKTLKETLSPYMIIHIYFTKFHAILRSGTLLSGRGIKGDLSIRVFKIQKRVVRLLAGVSFRTSCRQLFKKLNILTMASLCILEVTCFIRKNCKFLEQNSQVHQCDTRRKLDIHVKMKSMETYKKKCNKYGHEII